MTLMTYDINLRISCQASAPALVYHRFPTVQEDQPLSHGELTVVPKVSALTSGTSLNQV